MDPNPEMDFFLYFRGQNPNMNYMEQLPDEILNGIIDLLSSGDIKALFRLRTVSHRFDSLVIVKTKHLFLQVDKFDKIFHAGLGSYYSCCSRELASETMSRRSLKEITMSSPTNSLRGNLFLRCCSHVTKLVVELPANHATPSPKHEVKCMYKASFGQNLKSCVILYHTKACHCERDVESRSRFMGRKIQVMLLLLHECSFMAMKLVPHLENLVSLVVKDNKGDLEMVMDEEEIRKCRDDARAVKPIARFSHGIRIRMNVDGCMDIGGGLGQGTVVLGVVAGQHYENFDYVQEADLVRRAFGSGAYGMVVEKLLQSSFCIKSSF